MQSALSVVFVCLRRTRWPPKVAPIKLAPMAGSVRLLGISMGAGVCRLVNGETDDSAGQVGCGMQYDEGLKKIDYVEIWLPHGSVESRCQVRDGKHERWRLYGHIH